MYVRSPVPDQMCIQKINKTLKINHKTYIRTHPTVPISKNRISSKCFRSQKKISRNIVWMISKLIHWYFDICICIRTKKKLGASVFGATRVFCIICNQPWWPFLMKCRLTSMVVIKINYRNMFRIWASCKTTCSSQTPVELLTKQTKQSVNEWKANKNWNEIK